ncbi:MAG TPA: YihY/virulence factor BrkB family protein [Gemmatimonadaceae bacterium]|nr:YihY/virulence factor BrkB family protein [Gemmatimonadaceae bacterium]
MAKRPLHLRIGWTLRDYARRVWDNSGEDNVFFLAGGIAFNLLLAAVPFFLLFASGLAYLLNQSAEASSAEINEIVDRFLPARRANEPSPIGALLVDIIKSRRAIGIYSVIGFIWFSTRLFGSLRSVLAQIFDIDSDRGIVAGKIFDIQITIVSTLLLVAYTGLNAYLALATTQGLTVLGQLGLRKDMMGTLEYNIGQVVAFSFIALMFFSLYKFLPNRNIRWRTALIASLFTSLLLEVAKRFFGAYVTSFNPGSFYTGTIAALVIIVVWVYYASLIFILGGEVAQVYELRRVRRLQREAFED